MKTKDENQNKVLLEKSVLFSFMRHSRHTYFEALEDKKRGLNERILRFISKNTNKKPIFALFSLRK
jgi:hypothetical protein